MYATFLDASKAFDRVKFDTLFELLLAKHICPTIALKVVVISLHQSTMSSEVVWGGIIILQCTKWSKIGRCSLTMII